MVTFESARKQYARKPLSFTDNGFSNYRIIKVLRHIISYFFTGKVGKDKKLYRLSIR